VRHLHQTLGNLGRVPRLRGLANVQPLLGGALRDSSWIALRTHRQWEFSGASNFAVQTKGPRGAADCNAIMDLGCEGRRVTSSANSENRGEWTPLELFIAGVRGVCATSSGTDIPRLCVPLARRTPCANCPALSSCLQVSLPAQSRNRQSCSLECPAVFRYLCFIAFLSKSRLLLRLSCPHTSPTIRQSF